MGTSDTGVKVEGRCPLRFATVPCQTQGFRARLRRQPPWLGPHGGARQRPRGTLAPPCHPGVSPASSPMLRLYTLGQLAVVGPSNLPVRGAAAQRKPLALLALLAVHEAGITRDRLTALLWPEMD